jgi:hypothetical protein
MDLLIERSLWVSLQADAFAQQLQNSVSLKADPQ